MNEIVVGAPFANLSAPAPVPVPVPVSRRLQPARDGRGHPRLPLVGAAGVVGAAGEIGGATMGGLGQGRELVVLGYAYRGS
jgi:hypothetical protein